MSSNTMCTSAGKREELDVHLHVVREKRRIEQMVLSELSTKNNIPSSFSSGEMASFVREKVAERFPSGINFNGRTVYVNDEVHVKDDAVLLNSSERLLPAHDSLKRIYLGERGVLVQVVPSFYGRPAATLRFADGAQKTFYLDCLDLVNVRKSLSDTEKQPNFKRTVISVSLPVKTHTNEKGGEEKQPHKILENVEESEGSWEERAANPNGVEIPSSLPRKESTSGKEGQFGSKSLQFPLSRLPSENLNDFFEKNSNVQDIRKRAIGQTSSETISKVSRIKDKCESGKDEIGKGSVSGELESTVEMKRNRLKLELGDINLVSSGRTNSSLVLVDKKPSPSPFIVPPPPLFSSLTASAGPPPPPPSLKELRQTFLSPPPRSSSEVCSDAKNCGYPSSCISNPATDNEDNLSEESAFTTAAIATTSPPLATSHEKNEIPLHFTPPLEASSRLPAENLAEGVVTSLPARSSCSDHSNDVLEALTAVVHSPLLTSTSRSCSSLAILSDVHAEVSLAPSPADPIRIVNVRIPEERTISSLTVSDDEENTFDTDVIGAPCSSLMEKVAGDALTRNALTANESTDERVKDVGNSGALEMEDPCWWSHRSLGGGVPNLSHATFGTVSSSKEIASSTKNDAKPLSKSENNDISSNVNTVEISVNDRAGEKQQHSGSYASHIISPPLTLQVIESSAPLPDDVLKTLDREADKNSSDTLPKKHSNFVFLSNGRSDQVKSSSSSGVTSDPLFHDRAKKKMIERGKIHEPGRRAASSTATGSTVSASHRGALGLVKHHLSSSPANVLHEKMPTLENLGTPYAMEQLDTIGVAELLSSQSFLGDMGEDSKDEGEMPPLLEENVKLTGVPQSAPPGYKSKFSFCDANTSIPRYVPVKPSSLRRIMVAGSPLPQPTALNSQEITSSPPQQPFSLPRLRFAEVFYRRDASMVSILSAVTKALGWQKECEKNAERLFTLAGNEVLWEENIVDAMHLIATQGNLYHPQRSSTEVLTARAVEMSCPSSPSMYTGQSSTQLGVIKTEEKNGKKRWGDVTVAVNMSHVPLVQKSSSTLGSIVEENTSETILDLKFSGEVPKSGSSFPSGATRWNLDHSENIIGVSPLSNASMIPHGSGGNDGGAGSFGAHSVSASLHGAKTSDCEKIQRKGTRTSECKDNVSQVESTVCNAQISPSLTPNVSSSVISRNIILERCKEEDSCLPSGTGVTSFPQVYDPTQTPLTGNLKRRSVDSHTTLSGVISGSALSGSADTFQRNNDYVEGGGAGVDHTLIFDHESLTREAEVEAQKREKRSNQNVISTSSATQSAKQRPKQTPISFSSGKLFHIKVFENGLYDDDEGVFRVVTVRPNYKTIGALKTLITRELGWRGGRKVDLLYDATGVPITDLAQLCDGDALVASAGDRFIVPYPNSVLHREVTRKQLLKLNEC